MDYTTDAYIKALYQRTEAARNNRELCLTQNEQRNWLRSGLEQALGELPEASAPLNPVLLERVEYKNLFWSVFLIPLKKLFMCPLSCWSPRLAMGRGRQYWPAMDMATDSLMPQV